MQNKKEVSTIIGVAIIILVSVVIFSGAIAYLNSELAKVASIFDDTYATASLLR